jgi:preprotein translocase subunit SecD
LATLLAAAVVAVVAGVAIWQTWFARPAAGAVLVYDIAGATEGEVDHAARGEALNRVLETARTRMENVAGKLADVRLVETREGEKLEVTVFSKDVSAINRVERRLAAPGTLEFRILADPIVNEGLSALAYQSAGDTIAAENGAAIARWIPLDEDFPQSLDLVGVGGMITRPGEGGKMEVVVLLDEQNVNQHHVARAAAVASMRLGTEGEQSLDSEVNLDFNAEGAERMLALSSANQPTPSGQVRRLAIVVDGKLVSAPTLQGVVSNKATITGRFSRTEAEDLAAVLQAGPIRAELQQASRRDLP